MRKLNTNEGVAVGAAVVVIIIFIVWIYQNTNVGNDQLNYSTEQAASSIDGSNQLAIKDEAIGNGAAAVAGDTITVNYIGTLSNGQKFDSSYDRGQPFAFVLGAGQVIPGWDLGLIGMKEGGKRQLLIPASLGYGGEAVGPIPANSVLIFEVELLRVDHPVQ